MTDRTGPNLFAAIVLGLVVIIIGTIIIGIVGAVWAIR